MPVLCPLTSRFAALALVTSALVGVAQASVPFAAHVQELPAEVRLPRWEAVLQQIDREKPILRACLETAERCDHVRLSAWRGMMLDSRQAPWPEKLQAVNAFVNEVPYVRDVDRFGVLDYWASPLVFFDGGGDCEDYAIAKYVSLRKLGMPAEQMRIVVLEDLARGLAHAILAVRADGEVWVLDNYSDKIERFERLPHYAPYYAVNEERRWLHRLPSQSVPAAATH